MSSKQQFDELSIRISRMTTKSYSTSFSLGILCLKKEFRNPIYSLYGWVRFADEIVDSFHQYNKEKLLDNFIHDTYQSISDGISLNPILNSFQHTVNTYGIDKHLTDTFLQSMKWDLHKSRYNQDEINQYILGSAEVVGLMCLRIFCVQDVGLYEKLKPAAMSLGSAFQKVNFLRDLKADFSMGRVYFPQLQIESLTEQTKKDIEQEIEKDFERSLYGIKLLPRGARFGVYVAYMYYYTLFKKIKNTSPHYILKNRIRVRNRHKFRLLAYSYIKHQLNLI